MSHFAKNETEIYEQWKGNSQTYVGNKYKFPLSHCIIEECSPTKDVHIPLDTQSMWICNTVKGN